MIKFEEVAEAFKKVEGETILPKRSDDGSAGYDFVAKEDFTIEGNQIVAGTLRVNQHLFWTDVKILMPNNYVLLINIRSGLGTKHGLSIANTQGWIDASYAHPTNTATGGNIGICIKNNSNEAYTVHKGDKIAQGMLVKYEITDDDEPINSDRVGGFGSNGK